MRNFARGSYAISCLWLHSESGEVRRPKHGNIDHGGASTANLNRFCSFNVRVGRSIWVTIDGVRSNVLSFSGDPVGGSSPPPPPPPTDREVTISLGPDDSGPHCPYSELPCRWVNITMRNFARGSHAISCLWLHSESGEVRTPISGSITHHGESTETENRFCSFNVRPGRSIWVTVDGVRSNVLSFTGDPVGGSSPPPPPPPPPDPSPPGPPRVTVVEFRATEWGPAIYWEPVSGTTQYEIDAREQPTDKQEFRSGIGCAEESKDCGYLFQDDSRMGEDFRDARMFRVRAVNDAGPGPWSRWVQLPASLGAPPPPQVTVVGFRETEWGSELYWEPVSGATQYEIDAREQPVDKLNTRSDIGCRPTEADCGYLFQRDRTMEVDFREARMFRVRAVNDTGPGPWSRWTEVTHWCPTESKYRKDGRRWRRTRDIIALKSFETIDHFKVNAGEQGGVVSSDHDNLSHIGCGWITPGSSVEHTAEVSGNAVVTDYGEVEDSVSIRDNAIVRRAHIYENAQIYDNARVGNFFVPGVFDKYLSVRTRVYGNAEVYDEAEVSGAARVRGDARIFGTAEVYGAAVVERNAHVFDDAHIYGNVNVSGDAYIFGDYGAGNDHVTLPGRPPIFADNDHVEIYGDAEVSGDAWVFGNAKVFGQARVSGSARIYGTARVFGDMEVDSGEYDGSQEYKRAAEQLYKAQHDQVKQFFFDCPVFHPTETPDARRKFAGTEARDYLMRFYTGRTRPGSFAEAWAKGCSDVKILQSIVSELTEDGPWLYVATLAFKIGSVAKLSGFALRLMKLGDAANDVYGIVRSAQALNRLEGSLAEAYEALDQYGIP